MTQSGHCLLYTSYDEKHQRIAFDGRVLVVEPSMDSSGLILKRVTCEGKLAYLNDTVPVSYTHLDVYKRQALPVTVVERVLESVKKDHPLINAINPTVVGTITKILKRKGKLAKAVWGEITDEKMCIRDRIYRRIKTTWS